MKRLILLLCLLAALSLTACHVDNDPWPDTVVPSSTETVTVQPGGSEDPGLNG